MHGVNEWMCISKTVHIADERGRREINAMKTDLGFRDAEVVFSLRVIARL